MFEDTFSLDAARIINKNIILGVLVPDEVTGEQVFATQLDEDDYPGINNNTSRARRQGTRSNRG